MTERGRSRYAFAAAGSNTVAKRGPGTLYSVSASASGIIVRLDDTHSFAAGAFDINAASSNTISKVFLGSGTATFARGIGFETGLVFAAGSNAATTVEFE